LIVAPACNATAGNRWGRWTGTPAATSPQRRISLRPLYDPSRAKKFYLSGYAGANYATNGSSGSVYPSTYKEATNLGPHSTFNLPWPGH